MRLPIRDSRTSIRTLILVVLFLGFSRTAEATFSICAVDPSTGEVGSAGASCIAGSIILSDVHPGVGVVHTQSFWNAQNQQYARLLMDQGFSPEAIIDSLVANDAQGNPTQRQYGVVDLIDGGRSAAYTGVNCIDWKGDSPGPTYSVQGNILLGPEIIADMETAFLETEGSLAEKLMAALQAAKRPRADTRCTNKSAISAFIRVAQPNDPDGDYFLDLNVNNTSGSTDPIDVLQGLFDEWLTSADAPGAGAALDGLSWEPVRPNPATGPSVIRFSLEEPRYVRLTVFDAVGRELDAIHEGGMAAGSHELIWDPDDYRGVVFLRLQAGDAVLTRKLGIVR